MSEPTNPESPDEITITPAQVDLRVVMYTGMALWLIVGAAILVYQWISDSQVSTGTLLIAVAGIALGGIGLGWEKRNRSRYRSIAD